MRTGIFKAFATALGLLAGSNAEAGPTLLIDVTLADVAAATLTPDQSVLIRDGVIVEIGESVPATDATVLDAGGRFLKVSSAFSTFTVLWSQLR